jgi:hypothetical protein
MNFKNGLFIRVPKTGSTSILSTKNVVEFKRYKNAKIFSEASDNTIIYPNSYYASRVISVFDKFFCLDNYFTFGFVRNPFDRAVSSWKFGSHISDWGVSFKDFCMQLRRIDTNPEKVFNDANTQHICDQYPLLKDDKLGVEVNFIGRFENLQEDFNIICDKIGIPKQKLPHKNKGKHKHYTEYYDDETKQIVAEKYRKDIEYFGYEFGEWR